MNVHTIGFCQAASRHYAGLQAYDLDALRPVWARARALAKVPALDDSMPVSDEAIAAAAPGGTALLPYGSGELQLTIEGELCPGPWVQQHVQSIRQSTGRIVVRINSTGGDVAAALAIHDALVDRAERAEVLICGACASSAVCILAAADKRTALSGSRFWLHPPSTFRWGNAIEFREAAAELETVTAPRMRRALERICRAELVGNWLAAGDHHYDAIGARAVGLITDIVEPLSI